MPKYGNPSEENLTITLVISPDGKISPDVPETILKFPESERLAIVETLADQLHLSRVLNSLKY